MEKMKSSIGERAALVAGLGAVCGIPLLISGGTRDFYDCLPLTEQELAEVSRKLKK